MTWAVIVLAVLLLCGIWVRVVAWQRQREHDEWLREWAARMSTPLRRPDDQDDWR